MGILHSFIRLPAAYPPNPRVRIRVRSRRSNRRRRRRMSRTRGGCAPYTNKRFRPPTGRAQTFFFLFALLVDFTIALFFLALEGFLISLVLQDLLRSARFGSGFARCSGSSRSPSDRSICIGY